MWKLFFWKTSIALRGMASWNVLMFLKIVTKRREIQKSKLNNPLTKFLKKKSHSILSRRDFLKLFICFAITWNFNFSVNLLTSFLPTPRLLPTAQSLNIYKYIFKSPLIYKNFPRGDNYFNLFCSMVILHAEYHSFKIFVCFWLAQIHRLILQIS